MRKSKLLNVLPSWRIDEIKKFLIEKCNFAPCISKIDEEAPCEFQFVSFFLLHSFNSNPSHPPYEVAQHNIFIHDSSIKYNKLSMTLISKDFKIVQTEN